MSTASHPTSEPLAVGAWGDDGEADSKSERYLARRLAAASADYKGVALTTFLLGAGVATLLWIASGILLEHWIVAGGLPRWARWTWLLMGLAAIIAAGVRWILPLLRYRVNLVYAARVIEKEHPELHNDLVNTVLVKAHPEGNAATVVRSLGRRAAKRLSAVPTESVIDRSQAVRLAYALAVLVGLACLYSLAAPKSMLTTTARLLAPWARVAAPTRVRFEPPRLQWRMPGEEAAVVGPVADRDAAAGGADGSDPNDPRSIKVDAGGATLVRGRQLFVSSAILGLRRDEQPVIVVTPLLDSGAVDGAAVPWRVEMTRVGGETAAGQRYAAVLPDATRGLDQSVAFTMQAGDGRSEPIRVALVDSPTLLVREVRYEFPAYMQRERETVAWQGDLRAVEGTRVVITAESNQPLESAWIDFGCDGSRDLKLKVGASDLARASGSFVLQMNPERTAAEHASYRLVFQPRGTALAGREQMETEKLEHRIEVLADLAPEISIEEPQESPARVPPGAPVTLRVRALDPDFGLARVGIETRVQGGAAQPEIVLPGSERRTAFNGVLQVVPERLGAGAGSALEYRGVAVDTRPNQPNVTHTPWKLLQIDASASPRQPEKAPPRSGERDPGRRQGDPKDAGGSSDGESDDDGEPSGSDGQGNDSGDGSPSGTADGQGMSKGADGEKQQDGQGKNPVGEQPAGGKPEAAGEQRPNDGSGQKPEQSGGGQQNKSQQKTPQQNSPQQNSGEQGEPQPGQQGGAAGGSQQGGKQSQPGDNKQQGSSQGQGSEAGGASGTGQGRGGQGKSGSGKQPDGEQADGAQGTGGQGTGGQQAGKTGSAQQAGGDRPGKSNAGKRGGGENSQGGQAEGQRGGGQQGGGQQQPRPTVASDGTNDGEAMERILDHRRQAGGNPSDGMKSGKTKPDGDGANERGSGSKAGENSSNEGKPAGQNPTGKPGERNPGEGMSADGEPQAGTDGEKNGDQNSGERQGDAREQGQGQPGQGQQGQGQPGQGQQGQGQQGQGQQGQGQQGQGQQGQGQQGQGQQGQGQQGQGQQGQGQQGQGQQGQGQQGQGQQGQGQQGQGAEQGGSEKGGKPMAGPAGEGAAQPQGDPKQEGEAGGKPSGQQAAGPPPEGAGQSSPVGGGGRSEGAGTPIGGAAAQGPPPSRETEWGSQELENARNAADLALEHLRKTVESGRTDVLDELGWSRDQARAFLERWEAMRRQSESPDVQKRGEFERVLRSLGLRPAGVQNSRDVPADAKGGQAEGRRSRPPSDYRERFKAFMQGTSGEQDASDKKGGGAE
jgi:hypothetical protein